MKVKIQLAEEELELAGLIDSGNQLYDPLTKTPVMIMHVSSLEHCLPSWLTEQIYSKTEIPQIPENDSGWATKLRLIPFRAVGVESQFLWAIKPDSVQVDHEGSSIVVNKVLIGLNTQQLSTNGEYQCIVHPKMLISQKNGDRLINERRDNMMKLKFYLVYLWYKVLLKLGIKTDEIYYIGGSEALPPPLTKEEEEVLLNKLPKGDQAARSLLIERNLRLVVYIARKFENTGINIEDLISIGTIGLIKAVNTFNPEKENKISNICIALYRK